MSASTLFSAAGRLHRQYMDAVALELLVQGFRDISAIRALMVLAIGDRETTPTELRWDGPTEGTNTSYNLSKLIEHGWVIEMRCPTDGRVKLLRNSERGLGLCRALAAMDTRHAQALAGVGLSTEDLASCEKTMTAAQHWFNSTRR